MSTVDNTFKLLAREAPLLIPQEIKLLLRVSKQVKEEERSIRECVVFPSSLIMT